MDAKEIKQSLKNAKEAIKSKDFKTALELCKTVLKHDRKNYTALVLFGVALQDGDQKDQAPKAFRKAIDIQPKQILAWQGLASYYEKESSGTEQKELLPIYQQLLSLESDTGKFTEICNKLSVLSLKLMKWEECGAILTAQLENGSEEQKTVIWKTLVSVLSQSKDLPAKLSCILETALATVIKDSETDDIEDYYKKYLRVLYRNKNTALLLEEARKMHLLFPKCESPLEWICKIDGEQVALDMNLPDDLQESIEDYYKKLQTLNPESSLALFAKGAESFKKKNFIESSDALKQVVGALPHTCYVWILLCRCCLQTQCSNEAEHYARAALNEISNQDTDEHMENFVLTCLVKSLSLQSEDEKLKEAVTTCMKILSRDPGNPDVIECLARAHIMLGNQKESEKCLQAIQNTHKPASIAVLSSLHLKRQNNQKKALEIMDAAVSENPDSGELWLELAKLHWEEKRYDLSLAALLKATKLDPSNYICYVYLGHYYSFDNRDLDKARRCYQKAFRLNPNCEEAGAGLSDIYRLQKNPESNIQLLTYVTKTLGGTKAKWAWLRLGLHHIDMGNFQEAIDSMLSVIRADPTDSYSWECLADAYYGRGAYTAALKSYQRVLELDPEAVYPAFQLGNIKQLIGLYEESIEDFKTLLYKHPDYVPALKSLGESYIYLARNYYSRQLLGCCRDACQRAVHVLTRAAEIRKDLSCLWKLMGDACSQVGELPEKYGALCVRTWTANSQSNSANSEEENDLIVLNKEEVFQHGIRCYCRSLKLSPNNSLLWHDLAIIFNLQANYAIELEAKKQLRENALAAIKKSIYLYPNSWQHWNLLGIIAESPEINNMELAQHAFIKAIQLENNNVITWTNLGTLYLSINEIKLAHEAFKVAQRTEPSYVQCWIGQALIAESMAHEDTMDLFRHTTQLGIHLESCIGYSHWVCNTLKSTADRCDPHYIYSIERMYAIPVAGDCMTWYTGCITNNPCAFNMLGLILERQQLYHGAAESFEEALKLLRNCEDCTFSDMVHSNYGRVLVHLQQYEEAIQQYQEVKKADFVSQCGLAVAYFKANKYEESYSTYETALEWLAPTDGLKSHILVAMAAMAYMCQGVEDSKTLLFQCIKLKPPSVQGLFAFCSLGMLHGDLTLAELALKELILHEDHPEYMSHIAVFKAYTHFLQGHSTEAVRALSKTVHRHPGNPSLWLALALLLLHLYSERKTAGAATCAEVALFLGRSTMDVSKVMSLVSLSHLLTGKSSESLRSSQKAVHMFPHIPENWTVLIASFMPLGMHSKSAEGMVWLKHLISHVRRKLDATRQMSQWLSNHERKVMLLADEYKKD